MEEIILASTSERRFKLLEDMGISYKAVAPEAEEHSFDDPVKTVSLNALYKAEDVFSRYPDRLVLSADTIVYLDGKIIGKPQDREDAFNMLSLLQGRWHSVYTGVTIISPTNKVHESYCKTDVHMMALSKGEIEYYINTGEPMGKAGAYALQGIGGTFVSEIRGSYSNVIGLPTSLVRQMLKDIGFFASFFN
ncbi:MAG: septum formation protein Maf [Christensenellaceae bacterium]|nr:septum formation protein Maf [Christensenellaceae bacterium]